MGRNHSSSINSAKNPTRRDFVKTAGSAIAIPYVLTSSALGQQGRPPASDRIVMAGIGLGNQGSGDQRSYLRHQEVQYVAVCDVRDSTRERAKAAADEANGNTDCVAYKDFQEVLARDDIDAVHIATPDHWHAVMAVMAMRSGKDIYLQKPETRTLREGKLMVDVARRYARVASGGSQRVLGDYRRYVDPAWSGELGKIKSVNVNTNFLAEDCYLEAQPVPDELDWDMWLGPAPWAPYHELRASSNAAQWNGWRAWSDYSGGHITDWGAHHLGGATFVADVRELQPEEITYHEDEGEEWVAFRFPNGIEITHNRPGTENMAIESDPDQPKEAKPVPLYKGTPPEEPADLGGRGGQGRRSGGPQGRGGENNAEGRGGRGGRGGGRGRGRGSRGGIYADFVHCVRTRERPFRDIELAVNTAVLCHMVPIAIELKRSLKWNAAEQQFVDDAEANRLVDRSRREPWII